MSNPISTHRDRILTRLWNVFVGCLLVGAMGFVTALVCMLVYLDNGAADKLMFAKIYGAGSAAFIIGAAITLVVSFKLYERWQK